MLGATGPRSSSTIWWLFCKSVLANTFKFSFRQYLCRFFQFRQLVIVISSCMLNGKVRRSRWSTESEITLFFSRCGCHTAVMLCHGGLPFSTPVLTLLSSLHGSHAQKSSGVEIGRALRYTSHTCRVATTLRISEHFCNGKQKTRKKGLPK